MYINNYSFTLLSNYHTVEETQQIAVKTEQNSDHLSVCHSIPHHCWCILLTFFCILSVCIAGKLMEASMTLLMYSVLVSRPVWTE